MTKKLGHLPSRRLFILGVLILAVLGVAAYGVYYYSNMRASRAGHDQVAINKAQATVKDLNLVGDADLAATYVQNIQAGDKVAAAAVFTDRIAHESDSVKKLDLLNQYMNLALAQGVTDQALSAALAADALADNYNSHMDVSRAYYAAGDNAKRVEYIQKAITALDATAEFTGKQEIRDTYVLTLKIAQEG